MTPHTWSSRVEKEKVRTALFEFLKGRNQKLKSYLCLPGWDGKVAGLDIERGLQLGVITKQTKVIGYECKPQWAANIRKHFRPYPNVRIVADRLENAKLEKNSLDFAFLDFTGTINQPLYTWMANTFAPALRTKSSFAVAIPYGRREGNFYHRVSRRLNSDLVPYRDAFVSKFPAIWLDFPTIAPWLFILKSAMRSRSNTLRSILKYQDKTANKNKHVPMVVFLFEAVQSGSDEYPNLLERGNL